MARGRSDAERKRRCQVDMEEEERAAGGLGLQQDRLGASGSHKHSH